MYVSNIRYALLVMGLLSVGQRLSAEQPKEKELVFAIRKEALKEGIDPDLALAVAKVESNLNPFAIGKNGEIGLYQIMPFNAPGKRLDIPTVNIQVGIKLLKKFKHECRDMGPYYVICYNQGAGRRPKHPDQHPYYRKVVSLL